MGVFLKNLEAAAEAMNCKLVYCLIPLTSLEEIRKEQARIIARERIAKINQYMLLEQQGLTPKQIRQEEDELAEELLQGNSKDLWG